MKIVIAGAGGLVGGELTRRLSNKHQVLPLKRENLDVTDRQTVLKVVLKEHPALIINCSALGVDACELDPLSAQSVNVEGVGNLAQAASEIDAEFLHFSTNYVFDGKREDRSCYTIHDTPAPINLYGQTKLAGERAALAACERSFVVRTSWIFGAGKKNFLGTVPSRLKSTTRVRAITDISASVTYVRDLAARVEEILSTRHYATYHVVNDGVCSYYDFALEAARIMKLTRQAIADLIEPVRASEIHQVLRPLHTPMCCTVSEELGLAPMREWRAALADYIHND